MNFEDRPNLDEAIACRDMGATATMLFWRAVRSGALRDRRGEPCADCGRVSKQHDHRDYAKWWEVDPVCIPCNVKRGRAAPFADTPRSTGQVFSADHRKAHLNQFALSMLEATTEFMTLSPTKEQEGVA